MKLSLSDVVDVVADIAGDCGVQNFMPVVLDIQRQTVRILSEIPHDLDHETPALDWAASLSLVDYAVAYRRGEIIFVRLLVGGSEEVAELRPE